ncbi:MAG: acetylornithine/succinylornithine family transaminase [Spirochaetales bacterium]|nr:acetylornithine/succinylornithine family transaminase [Spirochaetales bacterium]
MVEITKAAAKNPPFPKNYSNEFLVLDKGEGVYLYDVDGKKYLDFGSGIAVNALGYGLKGPAEIAAKQMMKVTHVSNLYTTEPTLELAYKLTTAGNFAAVHFGNSGSEANEAAIKYARLYAKRTKGEGHHKILSFNNAFHGRTLGALACTPTEKYQEPFGPLMEGTLSIPFNDTAALEKTLDESFAAVFVEPVQGEGGLEVISPDFAEKLNELCKKFDILLVADEVQTGMGRTGEFFASAGLGLTPDIITLAKPLAGGLPLSATLIPDRVNKLIKLGEHGTTFGGGPVTCAVACYMVDAIFHPVFLTKVKAKGEFLKSELEKLASEYSFLGKVKGTGLMQGVEVIGQDAEVLSGKIIKTGRDKGLLILRSGKSTLRILPPLVIEESEILEGISILKKVFKELKG